MAANVGIALLLRDAGGGLGVQSAALHVIADALTDAAVVVGALTLLLFGWTRADAVVSLLIAALVVVAAIGLLREALHILNEGTPRDVDTEQVRARIAGLPGVDGVHDLHIWSLDREHRALSAHIIVGDRPLAEVTAMIRSVEVVLCDEFGIDHATVQPECPSCSVGGARCTATSKATTSWSTAAGARRALGVSPASGSWRAPRCPRRPRCAPRG